MFEFERLGAPWEERCHDNFMCIECFKDKNQELDRCEIFFLAPERAYKYCNENVRYFINFFVSLGGGCGCPCLVGFLFITKSIFLILEKLLQHMCKWQELINHYESKISTRI